MSRLSDENIRTIKKLPELDYSKIPPKIKKEIISELGRIVKPSDFDSSTTENGTKKAVSLEPEVIIKKSKLTWDGKQFTARIPTEIATDMRIDKDDQILFVMVRPLPGSDYGPILKIEMVHTNGNV